MTAPKNNNNDTTTMIESAPRTVHFKLPNDNGNGTSRFISATYSINDDNWNLIWYDKDDLIRIQEENFKINSGEIKECRLGLEPSCTFRRINATKVVLAEQERQKTKGIYDDEALSAASIQITRAARITAVSTATNLQGEVRIYQMNTNREESKRKKLVNTSERDEDFANGTKFTKQRHKKKIKRRSRRSTFGKTIADKLKRPSRTVETSPEKDNDYNYNNNDDDDNDDEEEENIFVKATKEEKRRSDRKSLGDYLRNKLSVSRRD